MEKRSQRCEFSIWMLVLSFSSFIYIYNLHFLCNMYNLLLLVGVISNMYIPLVRTVMSLRLSLLKLANVCLWSSRTWKITSAEGCLGRLWAFIISSSQTIIQRKTVMRAQLYYSPSACFPPSLYPAPSCVLILISFNIFS